MKVKVGDKVKFLNDVGGGVVTRVEDKFVYVENHDGFEIPTSVHEIVVSEAAPEKDLSAPSTNTKPSAPQASTVNQVEVNTKQDCNILIAVSPEIPDKASISDLKLYFINDSGYGLLYACFVEDNKGYRHLKSGYAEPNTKLMLKKFFQSDISKIKHIKIQAILSGAGTFQPKDPINQEINMAAYTFYKQATYVKNDYFTNDAFIYNINSPDEANYSLTKETIKEIIKVKEKEIEDKLHKSPKPQTELVEVDLHIHQVTENYEGLTNGEMVELQMNCFREELLNNLSNSQVKKVVFIHGMGNGTLKRELRTELERKYPKLSFQDASFKEYGFGATLVYLRN